MLSKLKNIAKRWEGCSKSHFSHIRNKVEKVTLRPQNRAKIKKKWFRNRYTNQVDFQLDFLSIWAPFWSPQATLKFNIFP